MSETPETSHSAMLLSKTLFPENISDILVTEEIFHVDKSPLKTEFLNAPLNSVTEEVSQPEMSPLNPVAAPPVSRKVSAKVKARFCTVPTSHAETSCSNADRKNKPFIVVADEVSQDEMSILNVEPANIKPMS